MTPLRVGTQTETSAFRRRKALLASCGLSVLIGCHTQRAVRPGCEAVWNVHQAEAIVLGIDPGALIMAGPCVDQSEAGRLRFLQLANGLIRASYGTLVTLTEASRLAIEGHPEDACWYTTDEIHVEGGQHLSVVCEPAGGGRACQYRIQTMSRHQ